MNYIKKPLNKQLKLLNVDEFHAKLFVRYNGDSIHYNVYE